MRRVGSSKWKICLVIVTLGIAYGTENALGQGVRNQRPGRKFRVPGGYEVEFGTWPLMEVTKLQKRPPKLGALGGFMQNAIHSNFNKPHHGHKFPHHDHRQKHKFRHVPPLPPLPPPLPPLPNNNGPVIFANIKAPIPPQPLRNAPIGIPISIPGNNNHQHHPQLFNNGPLPVKVIQIFQAPTTTTTTTEAPPPLPPPISSVMGKAAYSGFFPNAMPGFGHHHNKVFNNYPIPSFSRGPPHPPPQSPSLFGRLPFIKYHPGNRPFFNPHHHQQQQSSFISQLHSAPPPSFNFPNPPMVISEPALAASERLFQISKVPQIPPVIHIGNHPPNGYSMTHGEQQLITLKLPDVKMGKKMDTVDLLRGAEYKNGPGISPYHRRQDFFKPGPPSSRTEDKKLPDVGAIYTVNMVLQTPNISAPTNGSDSPHFAQGMEQMVRIYGNSSPKQSSSPLDGQVKLLGKLFTELQRLKPGKSRIPDDGPSYTTTTVNSDPFGVSSTPKKYYTPKVDAPLLAVHIQSYSVPEPGSSDPDVLESARMFGLQGHKIEFGSTNEIINLMDTAQKSVGNRVPLDELGYTRGEVNHNLQEWIRSYVTLTRKMKDQAHSKGEGIASNSFKQHQVHLRMPDNSMQPMDPKLFSQGASITNAGAVATYQG